MLLYLIRHANTLDNKRGRMQSIDAQVDWDTESEVAVKNLHLEFEHKKLKNIHVSPLRRAIETARYFAGDRAKLTIVDFIYEYVRPNLLEGASQKVAIQFWEEQYVKDKYDPRWKLDGSESFEDILSRVKKFTDFIFEYAALEENMAVVGHGTFFRHLMGYLLMKDSYDSSIFFNFLRKIELDYLGYILLEVDIEKRSAKIVEIRNHRKKSLM